MTSAPVSLNKCSLMRDISDAGTRLEARRQSRTERRRRNLRRGIDRWHLDTVHTALPGRVWLVALTFAADEPAAARGKIRDFWHAYRELAPKSRYFSWLELQHRGAVHYHALVVGSPWRLQRDARRWIQGHWPWASIQPSVQSKPWQWFRQAGGRYVKAYAKKSTPKAATLSVRSKAYQQEYEEVPRELRTFQASRTRWKMAQLDEHRDQLDVGWYYAPDPATGRIAVGYVVATVRHTAARGGCTLRTRRDLRMSEVPGGLKGRKHVVEAHAPPRR